MRLFSAKSYFQAPAPEVSRPSPIAFLQQLLCLQLCAGGRVEKVPYTFLQYTTTGGIEFQSCCTSEDLDKNKQSNPMGSIKCSQTFLMRTDRPIFTRAAELWEDTRGRLNWNIMASSDDLSVWA